MLEGINIKDEICKSHFLQNRTSKTTSEEESKAFIKLSKYRDGAIFVGGFSGESPWERHSNGDEIILVLKGIIFVEILDEENKKIQLTENMLTVVPEGKWHCLYSPNGVTIMTITPQPTEVSIDLPNNLT